VLESVLQSLPPVHVVMHPIFQHNQFFRVASFRIHTVCLKSGHESILIGVDPHEGAGCNPVYDPLRLEFHHITQRFERYLRRPLGEELLRFLDLSSGPWIARHKADRSQVRGFAGQDKVGLGTTHPVHKRIKVRTKANLAFTITRPYYGQCALQALIDANSFSRSGGRYRLPVCVVRIRCMRRFMALLSHFSTPERRSTVVMEWTTPSQDNPYLAPHFCDLGEGGRIIQYMVVRSARC
jgi:hypothetical protein